MPQISELSPAVSLALLKFTSNYDSSLATHRNMLKATFFELLLVKALAVFNERKWKTEVPFIGLGPTFNSYPYKPHHQTFLECLTAKRELKGYIQEVSRRAQPGFKTAILRELLELGLTQKVYKKFLFIRYQGLALTYQGMELKARLQQMLAEGERLAGFGYQQSPDNLRNFTAFMGLNVVLLTSFSPVLMQQWNSIINQIGPNQGDGSSYSDSGSYYGVDDSQDNFMWGSIGSFGDSDFSAGFESAFDSSSGGSDWGGSDSGSDSGGGDSGDGGDGGGDGGGGD